MLGRASSTNESLSIFNTSESTAVPVDSSNSQVQDSKGNVLLNFNYDIPEVSVGSDPTTNLGIATKQYVDNSVSSTSNLTTGEISQLENIDSVSISNTQWGYVGNLNQDLNSTSNVTFNDITINGSAHTYAQPTVKTIQDNNTSSIKYSTGGTDYISIDTLNDKTINHQDVEIQGDLLLNQKINTINPSVPLDIGGSNTAGINLGTGISNISVYIGGLGSNTTVNGRLNTQNIDSSLTTTINMAQNTATDVKIHKDTEIVGNLTISGTVDGVDISGRDLDLTNVENKIDQSLLTTDNVQFADVTATGNMSSTNLDLSGDLEFKKAGTSYITVPSSLTGALNIRDAGSNSFLTCDSQNLKLIVPPEIRAGGGIDSITGETFIVGSTIATDIKLNKNTEIVGNLVLSGTIDQKTAVPLNIGTVTANEINISKLGDETKVKGTLTVDESASCVGGLSIQESASNICGLTFSATTNDPFVIIPANKQLKFEDASFNTILGIDSTTGDKKVNIAEPLNFTSTTPEITIPDNNATALDIKEGANSYLTFDTTNNNEAVIITQPLDVDTSLKLDNLNFSDRNAFTWDNTAGGNFTFADNDNTVIKTGGTTGQCYTQETFDVTDSASFVFKINSIDTGGVSHFVFGVVNSDWVNDTGFRLENFIIGTLNNDGSNYMFVAGEEYNTLAGFYEVLNDSRTTLTETNPDFNLVAGDICRLDYHNQTFKFYVNNTLFQTHTRGNAYGTLKFCCVQPRNDGISWNISILNPIASIPANRFHSILSNNKEYLTFDTGAEKVNISKPLNFNGTGEIKIPDNNATALVVKESGNSYLTFDTSDGAENVGINKNLNVTGYVNATEGIIPNITRISNTNSPYSINRGDFVILVNSSSGAVVLNLPDTSAMSVNQEIVIKNNQSGLLNAITINRSGSDLIDGSTSLSITTGYQSYHLVSDLANSAWFII